MAPNQYTLECLINLVTVLKASDRTYLNTKIRASLATADRHLALLRLSEPVPPTPEPEKKP